MLEAVEKGIIDNLSNLSLKAAELGFSATGTGNRTGCRAHAYIRARLDLCLREGVQQAGLVLYCILLRDNWQPCDGACLLLFVMQVSWSGFTVTMVVMTQGSD